MFYYNYEFILIFRESGPSLNTRVIQAHIKNPKNPMKLINNEKCIFKLKEFPKFEGYNDDIFVPKFPIFFTIKFSIRTHKIVDPIKK